MRVLFWGTPTFAVPTLRALGEEGHDVVAVVTQPDRPAGRGRHLRPSPVKIEAQAEGIPVLEPRRPRGDEFVRELGALAADISVVVAYGHILPREVLDVPPRGSINVHASLLPALRGAAPIHWAIARGHDRTGVTIMRMAEEMDAGAILHQVEVPIGPYETSSEVAARLAGIGALALVETLALLEHGTLTEREQDHAQATFAPKIGRELARIDWSRTPTEVVDHVRAMDEVPGAWTLLAGEPLKLFRPRPSPHDGSASPEGLDEAPPGTVIVAETGSGRGLGVAVDGGIVWFAEAQPPGRRRMEVGAWLLGRGLEAGVRFE